MSAKVIWLLEPDVLVDLHTRLRVSAKAIGHQVKAWSNSAFDDPKQFEAAYVLFHGSLGVAAKVAESGLWWPGAFCDVERFACSEWYAAAGPWLLNHQWVTSTVELFVSSPDPVFEQLEARESVFVRPDSPLKPFSGRVLQRDNISLRSLDHGFYYEDPSLPIVIAPVRQIDREWRFLVVNYEIITGSEYVANGRSGVTNSVADQVREFANRVAAALDPPEPVYILDIAESDGQLGLVELNPFSGADLYACDMDAVVAALDRYFSAEHHESMEQLKEGIADIDAGRTKPAEDVIAELSQNYLLMDDDASR
jgi:hypothetical protein